MTRTSSVFAPAFALSLFTGFIDAQAFLAAGGFFAAFMSGNTTRLAAAFSGGNWAECEFGLALVLSFVAGVILAEVLIRLWPARREAAGMILVAVLVAISAVLTGHWPGPFEPLPLAAAMGAMHAAMGAGEAESRHPGYPTDALVRVGQGMADALMGVASRADWMPRLLLWLGFAVGAALGVAARAHDAVGALWIGAMVAVAVSIWAALRRHRIA